MKEIECKMGIIKKCTGSSSFTYHNTTIIAIIDGPFNSKDEIFNLKIRWNESNSFYNKINDKYFSLILKNILSKFIISELDPFKTIEIVLHVINKEKNTLFCAVNACLLALIDAGIPLNSLFFATTTCSFDEEVMVFRKTEEGFIKEYSHCLGGINEEMIKKGKDKLEYIEDILLFEIKKNLLSK